MTRFASTWCAALAALMLAGAALAQDRAAALKSFHQQIAAQLDRSSRAEQAIDDKMWNDDKPRKVRTEEVIRWWSAARDEDLRAAQAVAAIPVPAALAKHEGLLQYARLQASNVLRARATKYHRLIQGTTGKEETHLPGGIVASNISVELKEFSESYQKVMRSVGRDVGTTF